MGIIKKLMEMGREEHSLENADVREDLDRMRRVSFIISKAEKQRNLDAFGARSTVSGPRRPRASRFDDHNMFTTKF